MSDCFYHCRRQQLLKTVWRKLLRLGGGAPSNGISRLRRGGLTSTLATSPHLFRKGCSLTCSDRLVLFEVQRLLHPPRLMVNPVQAMDLSNMRA